MTNKKGFTLIELLVVIAIIGLLSTLAVVSLNNARGKARDARRVSDVKAIQTAIELYKADSNDVISDIVTAIDWAAIETELAPYLQGGLPADPGTGTYTICRAEDDAAPGTNSYFVHAVLENNPPSAGLAAATGWAVDGSDCMDQVDASVLPTCDSTTNYCVGIPARSPAL